MAYMKEKKEHDYLLNLLKKHFNADEIEEAMSDFKENEDDDDDYYDEVTEEMEDEKEEMIPKEYMEDEDYEDEEEDEEEMELPKDKRKGLAVVIIQKKLSKPNKDM